MTQKSILTGIAAFTAIGMLHAPAMAGGIERGGYNVDLLFDRSPVTFDSSATYVVPQRKLENVTDVDTTSFVPLPGTTGLGPGGGNLNGLPNSVDDTESYWVPRIGLKAGLNNADCMIDYSQPWGAHTNPGRNWAGANSNIETKIESDNYALTCSYRFDAGPGQLRIIGGAFYQELSGFKERLVQDFAGIPGAPSGVGRLDLEADGWGWRVGAAYEIPEYALRASLVYNSAVKLNDITGTVDLSQVNPVVHANPIPVEGSQDMPDSLEFKIQSGIAPDWLAFGSVKWTDWSRLQTVPFQCSVAGNPLCRSGSAITRLELGYRDGWTISGGVGHKFNDQWSGALSLTWDRGTSQGFGAQTDTWTVGTGVSYTPTENVEFRLAGVLGVLTSGSSGTPMLDGSPAGNGVEYSFDNDLVAAISTSLKVKF